MTVLKNASIEKENHKLFRIIQSYENVLNPINKVDIINATLFL